MSAYLALFHARFRSLLQYRAAALAGFGTQLFWGSMRVMVFTAFYAHSDERAPMSLSQTISYLWLGQAFLLLVPWNVDREIALVIRSGNVAYELVRPLDLYWLWFARTVAMRIAPALLRCLPMLVVAGLWLGLEPPASPIAAVLFLAALTGAVVLSSALTMLMTASLFWTVSGDGMLRLFPALALLASGMVVPLPFFPEATQSALAALPFRGVVDAPFRLYLGHIPATEAPTLLLHQLCWSLLLIALGRAVVRVGVKRTVVQGG